MRKMIASLLGLVVIIMAGIAGATTEVETDEEMLGYVRLLFSEKKVVEAYGKLVSEGYVWTEEMGYFGSMVDEKNESFYGQVHLVMQKGKKKKSKRGSYNPGWFVREKGNDEGSPGVVFQSMERVLVIDFLWSRKWNRIEKVDVDAYTP